MAGRENQGELWVLTLGLDLLSPILCAGFRTLSLLCAKFGEQRPMFNEFSSWLSMNLSMLNHESSRWLNQEWDGLKGCLIRLFNYFLVLIPHHNQNQSMQSKGTHQDISEIFWVSKLTRRSVAVYHFNYGWSWFLDFVCWLIGQHSALKKY
jgi:hypothetical protein